jgi:hypothetical protein
VTLVELEEIRVGSVLGHRLRFPQEILIDSHSPPLIILSGHLIDIRAGLVTNWL